MSQNKKLYVGSLPYSLSEEELKDVFTPFGAVVSARIIMDKMTGKSKGFGFVEMETEDSALKAIDAVHGSEVQGRTLVVNIAHPEQKKTGFAPRTDRRRESSWQKSYS
ncbi:MAG: RNA-binding protein [Chlamydiae bacterium]|nr:RNA-binding protein [Chlamydiota bacterium]